MSNCVPSPDVKKDVPFPKSSFTHSAGIAQAHPLFGQNTGDTGKDMPSLSNTTFTSNSSLPNQLGTPSSNVFARRPTSCTTTNSTGIQTNFGSSSSVEANAFRSTGTMVKLSAPTGTDVTNMIRSFFTVPVGSSSIPVSLPMIDETNAVETSSAGPDQNYKTDGQKAQKREREVVQGPSRESDEKVLEAMPYDPNYMTTRFCDSKNLVKSKISNKTKKSMSTTPYCAVKRDEYNDDDEDDVQIVMIAEQPAQYMSKNKKKKLRHAAAAAAARDLSTAKKSISPIKQELSLKMKKPAAPVTQNKRKKTKSGAPAASGISDGFNNLDI